MDITMGNYLYSELAEAFDPEDPLAVFIGAVYYYVYLMLMTILVLNIIIAILMDAYSSVKTDATSSYTEQLKYNVGPIWGALYNNLRRPFLERAAKLNKQRAAKMEGVPGMAMASGITSGITSGVSGITSGLTSGLASTTGLKIDLTDAFKVKWSDERWIRDLTIIQDNRVLAGLPKNVLRIGRAL